MKIEIVCDQNGQSSKIVVRDFSKNQENIIQNEIQNLTRSKQTSEFCSEFMPGFEKILKDKKFNFKNSIKNIQGKNIIFN